MNSGLNRSPVIYSKGSGERVLLVLTEYSYLACVCQEALVPHMQGSLARGVRGGKRNPESVGELMGWEWRIWVGLSYETVSVNPTRLYVERIYLCRDEVGHVSIFGFREFLDWVFN